MKIPLFSFLRGVALLLPLLAVGCSSSRALYTIGAAGAGAAVANIMSKGNPIATAGGAVAAAAASELIQSNTEKQRVESYNKGYDRGRSDAAKQQYWLIQSQQKAGDTKEAKARVRFYTLPAETNVAGVKYVPRQDVIRVEE